MFNNNLKEASYRIEKFVRHNYLKVQVYFSTNSVTTIEEKPEYTWDQYLASLGGALSLYLGISLVSVFELLDFLIKLLIKHVN